MPNPTLETDSRSLPSFWAKLDRDGAPPSYQPLVCHILDVAAVSEALWDEVLPDVVRHDLAHALGLDLASARAWLAFLCGVHDIGKLSPAFQLRPAAGPLLGALQAWGRCAVGAEGPRHGVVSTIALRQILATHPLDLDRRTAGDFAALAGGHHGTLPTPMDLKSVRGPIEPACWHAARAALAMDVFDLLTVPRVLPRTDRSSALLSIAGLISICDWIGSDEHYFPHAAVLMAGSWTGSRPVYLESARQAARGALRALGWFTWRAATPGASFANLFPFIAERRPLQDLAVKLADGDDRDDPQLVIIEAPMGEGKTEAALYLADRWQRSSGRAGWYLALPTQATSNQMFSRGLDFLRRQSGGEKMQLQLLHGHAALSAEFEILRQGHQPPAPTGIGIDEAAGAQVAATAWFSYRKRGLLAPFGIGTVDQSLLAALQARHVFVRLFGLTRRTVIIDEVHAYDTYMSTLLERLLEWLAASGSPVILLSATLPTIRRSALAAAYGRGLGATTSGEISAASYPGVTQVRGGGVEPSVRSYPIGTSAHSCRTLGLVWVDNTGLDDLLRARLADGGCAAVVCNTVSRAQAVYDALRGRWAADKQAPTVDLLHARFPYEERRAREQRAIGRFGPRGQRPYCSVLISTQIIEQSLDVDFDAMVTDMAPVDLLLQRSGRLHRHTLPRPARCHTPVLHVCAVPVLDDGTPQFDSGTAAVYDAYPLLRSWLALRERREVRIPQDIQALVDLVYACDAQWPEALSEALKTALVAAWRHLEASRIAEQAEAEQRWLRSPTADVRVWDFARDPREDDNPELHRSLQALTRLAPPSVTAVCLSGSLESPRLPEGTQVDLNDVPDHGQAKRLLERSLNIQRPGLVHALLENPTPAGWRRSPLLRHSRPLVFNEDRVTSLGGFRLRLDPDLGLVVNREVPDGI